jgi:hypothetical protein
MLLIPSAGAVGLASAYAVAFTVTAISLSAYARRKCLV